MQKNSKILAELAILVLAVSMATAVLTVNAHTPPWSFDTYSFIVVSPNPIGVGQTINVNFWLGSPPPTASAQYGDRWTNLTVKVTHPDGTIETLGPFASDATGGTVTRYTPTVVGNYTFQCIFLGETLMGANPAPGMPTSAYIGDYYEPSESEVFTLIVQEEPIEHASLNPLPSEYWTRPIYAENTNWYTVAGNWLGLAASTFATTGMRTINGNYNPYTTAPNTAHILWTKPEAFGGTIGGEYGGEQTGNYYSTSQYEPKFAPIIMNGILYYTNYPGSSTHYAGWTAVNLKTGETVWTKNTTDLLRCGQILNMITPNQYGGLAYLWAVPSSGGGFMAAQTQYNMYDAMTGNWILSIMNATSMQITNDANGNLIGYYVSSNSTGRYLNMWNSTRCINVGQGGFYYGGDTSPADNWMWRPTQGAIIDFKYGIQWTKPIETTFEGNPIMLGITAISDDYILMTQSSNAGSSFFQAGWMIQAGYKTDGQLIWGPLNRTEVVNSRVLLGSNTAGNGVWVELDSSALTATGYSLATGNKIWGPTKLPNVSPYASLGENYCPANGTLYVWTYGGDVYAITLADGTIQWEYHTPPAGYESPYGHNSLWTFTVGTIADGKLYIPEGHMYSPPLFHQAHQLCLNTTTGERIWQIEAFDVTSAPAIADGVMVTLNAYDNQIYAWGKSPTMMTVDAPSVGITTSTAITVSGSIYDLSSGAAQEAVKARFPNGLPAVSDDSMTPWMEYVYMQQPKPTNTTGVPIVINIVDSNGNYRTVGTTTSDASGYWALTWTPDIEGDYKVIADFAGSESYYGSSDEAFFNAAAPASTSTVAPAFNSESIQGYVIGVGVAIIVAIAIIGALIMLTLRKRA
ncbi:hypothetical protein GX563_01800 [Candidatus Bathyarchaeota archaeon]|nr:hypothetical protein [Candidatus Bathyarchaeota archaeon]